MLRGAFRLSLVLIALSISIPKLVTAASSSIVISELQTGSATSAGQEFVELYNPTTSDISLDGWSLDYKSATSVIEEASWISRAGLAGTIKAHGFYLLSTADYLDPTDAVLTAGLAAGGGHVRLVDQGGNVVDLVGWGTANAAEASPTPAPEAGQSTERLPGGLIEDGGNAVDTDNNLQDFILRTSPGPQSTAAGAEVPTSEPVPEVPAVPEVPEALPSGSAQIDITELLVDPASPLTDGDDEFIELYNPGSEPANLEGYVLKSGGDFHDSYTLPAVEVSAGGYYVLYSAETNLSLTNTGGAAQLLNPAGQVISQSDTYSEAPEGQSWSRFGAGWQWTLQLTPGKANVLAAPLAAGTATKAKAAKTAKKAAAKKSATKTSKAKAAKASKPKVATAQTSPSATATPGKLLLIGLVALTIGYAIYEFRHDIQNFYYLARRKLRFWGKGRPAT